MAFGRDGAELEFSIYDHQYRLLTDALQKIADDSSDPESVRTAQSALQESDAVRKRLADVCIFPF